MNNQNRIQLLQLRKFKKNFGFLSHYQGPIFTKRGLRAERESQNIKSFFLNDAKRFNWRPPPRAHIAISFKVFCGQKNPPEIYNVPKYYLDLLEGPIFNNDRQVRYLEASIWRSKSNDSDSSMYIQARRLVDMFKIWNISQEIETPFSYFEEEVNFPFPYLIDQKFWDIAEAQYKIISNSNISKYDRPGLKRYPTMMNRFTGIDPFILDLGQLPGKGESKVFQDNIAKIIEDFTFKYPLFKKIYLPIELDIQITKASFKKFKDLDLDNIAINICKEFRKFVLYHKVYINGYRIYVVENLEGGIEAGVRLKLLPAGAIESYNDTREKALAKHEEELKDDL